MTVSRVINGESNVRPATRDAVNTAISALNYAPNPAARNLAGAGQTRIGLLYSNPSAGFLSEFLLGSLDQAARSDIQIIVEKCELGEHEIEVTKHLIDGGIDGIVLPPPLCEAQAVLALLAAARIPTVVVAAGFPASEQLAVRIDDREAALTMTRHIMALGHRRIGFITGNPNLSASARRLEGYGDALREVGVPLDEALITHGLYTYRSGLDAAEQLLDLDDPPTAIFASNDEMAAGTLHAARRRGMTVPDDLSIIGFDDTAIASHIWPPMTTVHWPIISMARSAALKLLTDFFGDDQAVEEPSLFPSTLIHRASVTPPRDG